MSCSVMVDTASSRSRCVSRLGHRNNASTGSSVGVGDLICRALLPPAIIVEI